MPLALALALALTGCGRGSGEEGPPDILLVTIDTLRADRVAGVAPFLESLAGAGIRFSRAYATASWTLPSMASLMTGTYPARHGVEQGASMRGAILAQEVLPEDLLLLPEVLSRRGYTTWGITANESLAPPYGFARGFDRYECLGFEDDGARVVARLETWAAEIEAGRPWFIWIHVLDPHAPYTRREPWISKLWEGRRIPGLEDVKPAPAYDLLRKPWTQERLGYVRALYAAEIASTDALLRRVFERLDAGGDALAIVTSDHGEEFRDHGAFGHGRTLFEESLKIPLVVRLPRGERAGEVVDAPVSLVDVMPTILEVAGVTPPEQVQGRSLLGRLDAQRPIYARLRRDMWGSAVIRGDWKLVDAHRPEERRQLFDLSQDPAEVTALLPDGEQGLALSTLLETHEAESAAQRSGENPIYPLTDEQARALRELGYAR
jgi:arylsulfatase A-like enzyme